MGEGQILLKREEEMKAMVEQNKDDWKFGLEAVNSIIKALKNED